jgi:O-antigen/teichoic acid export membrane protein
MHFDERSVMSNLWRRLLSGTGHVRWVLADQILVSGSSFALAIVYARALGPESFGVYALITVAQQYFVSVSVSLIGNPLITTLPHIQVEDEKRQLIASSFAAQLLLGSGLALLAGIGLSIYIALGATGISWLAVLGLAASSFALPLLAWCRRLCFLNRDGARLFRFDALTYLPVLIAAFFLSYSGSLSLDLAVLLWGIASSIAVLYAAMELKMNGGYTGAVLFVVNHWRIARDFIVPFQAQWLCSQGIVYLAAPIVGTAGIGAYRSIAGVLGFTNSIGTALDNIMPIQFSEVYQSGGNTKLRSYTLKFGSLLICTLLIIIVPIAIFAEQLIVFLLGEAYRTYSSILWAQEACLFVIFVSRIAIYHERAKLSTYRIAISSLLGAVISIISVIQFSAVLGPIGLALSTLLGATAALIYLLFGIIAAHKRV